MADAFKGHGIFGEDAEKELISKVNYSSSSSSAATPADETGGGTEKEEKAVLQKTGVKAYGLGQVKLPPQEFWRSNLTWKKLFGGLVSSEVKPEHSSVLDGYVQKAVGFVILVSQTMRRDAGSLFANNINFESPNWVSFHPLGGNAEVVDADKMKTMSEMLLAILAPLVDGALRTVIDSVSKTEVNRWKAVKVVDLFTLTPLLGEWISGDNRSVLTKAVEGVCAKISLTHALTGFRGKSKVVIGGLRATQLRVSHELSDYVYDPDSGNFYKRTR